MVVVGEVGSRHADTEICLVMVFVCCLMFAFAPTRKAEEECMKATGEGSLAYRSAGR